MTNSTDLTNHAVAVYQTHVQAEEAVKTLNDAGYNMRNLSIVGQNYATEEHPIGFVNTGDRMLSWGRFGAFWGSLWGLLFGSAMLFVPGLGYVMFAGWIVSILEGAILGGGIAAIAAALTGIGIPHDSVVWYESDLKTGSFLLLAHGDEADVHRAKDLLGNTSATRIDHYTTKQTVASH